MTHFDEHFDESVIFLCVNKLLENDHFWAKSGDFVSDTSNFSFKVLSIDSVEKYIDFVDKEASQTENSQRNSKKQYKCNHCSKEFKSKDNFNLHSTKHEDKTKVDSAKNIKLKKKTSPEMREFINRIKELQCKICLAKFLRKIDYENHMNEVGTIVWLLKSIMNY